MSSIDEAIKRVTDEAMKLDEQLTTMIEEHLTSICTNKTVAYKLMDENKTLKELKNQIWDEARKRKKGNGAYIADAEIYKMAERYYEIDMEEIQAEQEAEVKPINKSSDTISLFDVL